MNDHDLPVKRQQAQIVRIARSSAYYTPRQVNDADLKLMRRIDKLSREFSFAGARMLRGEALHVGRKHVSTLMQRMGLSAPYRKPNTSRNAQSEKIFPRGRRKHAKAQRRLRKPNCSDDEVTRTTHLKGVRKNQQRAIVIHSWHSKGQFLPLVNF